MGQEAGAQIRLSDYLQELEQTFEVKFSYADEQINQKRIAPSNFKDLDEILTYIESKTQLEIQKLSERYYALSLKETLDICATVLDNFEQNTVMGATVEVLSSKIFKVTDENGGFYIENVPKDAVLRISYLGYKNLIVAASDLTHDQPCKTLLLSQFYQQLARLSQK